MKTITHLIITICLLVSVSNAQNNNLQQYGEVAVPVERLTGPSTERQTSEWYNYGQAIYDMGGNVSYFRNYLFPDSTVVFETTTGLSSVWKHSLGQVLDPTSFNFAANNTPLAATEDYTLDSVRFWYRYFRYQTGAPDTLVIQIYKDNHITFAPDPWSTGVPYARVAYNYLTRKGSTPDYEYTILLTDADTATDSQRALDIPVYTYVAADDKIAATITYFPGNPFNVGDTIDAYISTPPVNLINAFVVYDFRDNDKLNDPLEYNNQLNASQDVRYNISANGWNGKYIPGTAWNAGFYHLDMEFKVTTEPISVNEAQAENGLLTLSPNPATDQFTIYDANGTAEKAEVYSILGEKLFSQQLTANSRQQKIKIDVSSLAEGIYFVKIKTEQGVLTGKFIKQ